MIIARTVTELHAALAETRAAQASWAFVPTMGALHNGHLTLVREALQQYAVVVVSVFVNPTQFDRADDLARYPRQPERDAELLERAGASILFLPSVEEVYPSGQTPVRKADLDGLDTRYEGAARPGHFDGVVQVVRRLVQIVRPAEMFMGQKDAQQVAILSRAAAQEFWTTRITTVPTVREPSGLAMSSRNGQLSPAGFAKASALYTSLQEAASHFLAGQTPRKLEQLAQAQLSAAGLRPEYLDFVLADSFTPIPDEPYAAQANHNIALVAVAWLEGVRLIDNLQLREVAAAATAPETLLQQTGS